MIYTEKTIWLSILMTGILFVWLGDKPVHLDETNFLAMTAGDFLSPHSIEINWEGETQKAFDVLSNPPGIVWYLWIVRDFEIYTQRWMMFPWAIISLLGVYTLGENWRGRGKEALFIWCVSPFFWISGNALMPDIALFALIISGVALLWGRKYVHLGAFLCGLSALFRYSGLSMIPLIVGWAFFYQPKKWWSLGLAVSLPTALLLVHDVLVYQEWHFWHMIAFQAETRSSEQVFGQFGACFAMLLGGFFWSFSFRLRDMKIWGISSCVTGILLALVGIVDVWDIWHYGFFSLGFALVGHAVAFYIHKKEYWFVLWIFGGIVFLLNLRFMATRYWAPFMIPILLFLSDRFSIRQLLIPAGIGGVISLALAWDDYSFAHAQKELAEQVDAARRESQCKEMFFAGHWGWQYYLTSKQWTPIEDSQKISEESCIAFSETSWPQEFQTSCPETEQYLAAHSGLPIRVHSRYSRVNYHSNYLSSDPILRGFAPWGFGVDDWDAVHFFASCTRL